MLPSKKCLDRSKHKFQLFKNQNVLKPNYFDSDSVEKFCSLSVVCSGRFVPVNLSIKLDRQPFLNAIEIQNILSYTMLPPEFSAAQPRLLQSIQSLASAGVSDLRNCFRLGFIRSLECNLSVVMGEIRPVTFSTTPPPKRRHPSYPGGELRRPPIQEGSLSFPRPRPRRFASSPPVQLPASFSQTAYHQPYKLQSPHPPKLRVLLQA